MNVHTRSRAEIETSPVPGPSIVIAMADSCEQLAAIADTGNVLARLDLIFNDTSEAFGAVVPPTSDHARQILQFLAGHKNVPNLVLQCQVGIGRSQAVQAALARMSGADPFPILSRGTYNRALYRKLLEEMGIQPDPEPLVSIAVRVKYAPDRLMLFLLSMRRQRYENWEVVAVTDGPNEPAARLIAEIDDARVRLIQTEKPLGRWGHPYRQLGLDACRGEFIGMSNDDNYYVPGYLEQMVFALREADLAACEVLHSYFAWSVRPVGSDLGSWIARASLIRKLPWTGCEFTSDTEYLETLAGLTDRTVRINRPLLIHN